MTSRNWFCLFVLLILNVSFVLAVNVDINTNRNYNVVGSSVNPQYTNPQYDSYTSGSRYNNNYNSVNDSLSGYGQAYDNRFGYNVYNFDRSQCGSGNNVVLQIVPGSCSPNIVRSDLLEEQNVPVFCKIESIQTNPSVDVSKIKSLNFRGNYPAGVSGVSYFPAKSAMRGYDTKKLPDILDSPVNGDLGYLVIVLSRQSNEATMPNFIQGTIVATIDYESEESFGVGESSFYLDVLGENDWSNNYRETSLWNGKSYLRAESIESDKATIAFYDSANNKQNDITLREGETSNEIFLGGDYCSTGLKVRLDNIGAPSEKALIKLNDKQTWVAKGDKFLKGKCRISDINSYTGGGKVSVVCSGKDNRFDLSLNPGGAEFTLSSGDDKSVGINEKVEGNVYLAYVGQDSANARYAVLIKDESSRTETQFRSKEFYSKIGEVGGVESAVRDRLGDVEVIFLKDNDDYEGITLNEISAIADKNWDIENEDGQLARDYYDKAIEKYNDLRELYPSEEGPAGDEYAAVGLFEAAQLAQQFEMNAKALELYGILIRDYPNSYVAKDAKRSKDLISQYDSGNANSVINLNDKQYFISLMDLKKPGKFDAGVVLSINGNQKNLALGDVTSIGDKKFIEVTKIEDRYVSIKYNKEVDGDESSEVKRLEFTKTNEVNLDGVEVKLITINLKKQAKVTVTPSDYGTRTETMLAFNVAIDKRAIPLSPEMAMMMRNSLIKVIEKIDEISFQLGRVISVMKAGCFATSSLLTAKNAMGSSGATIARNNLMTSAGGWNEKCGKMVDDGQYASLQTCLLENSNQVEGDIKIYGDAIQKNNNILKGQVGSEGDAVKDKFNEWCKGKQGSVTLPDQKESSVTLRGENGVCSWESMTSDQRIKIMTLYDIKDSGSEVLKTVAERELGTVVLMGKSYDEESDAKTNAVKNDKNLGVKVTRPVGDSVVYGDIKTITKGDSGHSVYGQITTGGNVIRVFIPSQKSFGGTLFEAENQVAGKEVIVELSLIGGVNNEYAPEGEIYLVSGGKVEGKAKQSVQEYMNLAGMDNVKQADGESYQNTMKNTDNLKVKYFEKQPYKGLPAEVVFDIENGWYVETTYVLSGFGVPYDESGRVVNYYICNAGPNGLIEFKQNGDDICRYYNERTGADVSFPGLSLSESKKIVDRARNAIDEAVKQYGKEKITINNQRFEKGISFGGESGKCTDFMSASDCNILFNVCDPVICPPSRCDMGGTYRVDNVIQSGIIGSLTLCLPNYNEGVAIPICLTGVHAGLDGFNSILKSTADCLDESIRSGRNVGICDEIRSVYICEFFWKQAQPFLGGLMQGMVGGFGTARGGGEYLSVNSAWQNTQNAADYMKNQYSSSSSQAFSDRSMSGIGSGICNTFVSQITSGGGFSSGGLNVQNIFEGAFEPESPPQFHGWFSEDIMSSATVPPTAHYKVYFHIYAGKNRGASYSVYLKGGDIGGNYIVDRGSVGRGSQVDKSRDFTAPSGFKQLCLVVNGQEECGFGQVSTSYLVNKLSDDYAQAQIEAEITSEKGCIAGTPSSGVSFNPNLQAGYEESQNPKIYNRGIIRVCSTDDPGKQTVSEIEEGESSSKSKWREVGYCDDPSLKCWLDTTSVEEVIRNTATEENILGSVGVQDIIGDIDYLTASESAAKANEIENKINELVIGSEESSESIDSKIIGIESDLEALSEIGLNNNFRARGLYLFGKLYKKIALRLLGLSVEDIEIIIENFEEGSGSSSGEVIVDGRDDVLSYGDVEGEDEIVIVDPASELESVSDLGEGIKITLIEDKFWGEDDKTNYRYQRGRWLSTDEEFSNKGLGYEEGVAELVRMAEGRSIEVSEVPVENNLDDVLDALRRT